MKDARISMIIAMTIFGTIGVFVRYIPLSSGELALYRAIMAVLLIGGYLLFSRQKISWKETQQSLFLLLVSGIAIGANWILLFEAYRYTTISTATLSYYFAPVIVMIVSPILFRERLTAKQIICFLLSAIGLVLTTNINIPDKNNHDLIGILFGLSAAFFYALAVILNKFIQNVNGIHRTFLQFLLLN